MRAFNKFQLFLVLKGLHTSLISSAYIIESRFKSFSPIREKNFARFFINAEGYYEQLYSDLNSARYEIFIRGWWVCPELYLKRPIEQHPQSRLDLVLERAAKRGVKIHIVLFKEYKGPMPNDSEYAKEALEKLHSNIRIIRHPSKQRLTSSAVQFLVAPREECGHRPEDLLPGWYRPLLWPLRQREVPSLRAARRQ